jgi:preprotein translocase subunit YajC
MIEQIIMRALETGLLAGLFVWLLFYVIRDGQAREKKYQTIIEQMNENVGAVKNIQRDIVVIKKDVTSIKYKINKGAKNEKVF